MLEAKAAKRKQTGSTFTFAFCGLHSDIARVISDVSTDYVKNILRTLLQTTRKLLV